MRKVLQKNRIFSHIKAWFLLAGMLVASINTAYAVCATGASGITVTHIGCNSVKISWTVGSGADAGCIVVAYPGATVGTLPTNGISYLANTAHNFKYGGGSVLGTGYVVYDSAIAGNYVVIIGLTPSTQYTFAVFEYNAAHACYAANVHITATTTAETYYPFMSMSMTDGCESTCGGYNGEGEDEFMLINTCSYGWNVSAAWGSATPFNLDYGQYGPPVSSNHTYTTSAAQAAPTATLNSATCGCAAGDFIDASGGGIAIPAWATVLLCSHPTSEAYCPDGYNFGGICSPTNPIYIIYASGGASNGSWSDESSCGTNGNRYFTLNFSFLGCANCDEYYQYDPCSENSNDGAYEIFDYPPATANSYTTAETPTYDGPSCSITASMLPVTLVSFTANYNSSEDNVQLNWETASEKYNKMFTIQRSADGLTWENIITVPGAGNSDDYLYYEAHDNSPLLGISYYRLTQTDYDGIITVKKTVSVDIASEGKDILVAPNPASSVASISFKSPIAGNALISICDLTGRVYETRQVTMGSGTTTTELDVSQYGNGIYFVTVNNTMQVYSAKLVVNHN